MSTISEYVQAERIRDLQSKGSGCVVEALRCGDGRTGLVLSVQASRRHRCAPRDDCGPWTSFEVVHVDGELPPGEWPWFRGEDSGVTISAGDLVRLLEAAGWPEAQLGKRWKKRGGTVPAGR